MQELEQFTRQALPLPSFTMHTCSENTPREWGREEFSFICASGIQVLQDA